MHISPTGSGKTILALYLIAEALKKLRRAIFVADRITLIDQTSATAYQHGLMPHGIIQADHPMADPRLPFQSANAQTLGRRRWPSADLIIADEAHTQLRAWTEHSVHWLTPFDRGVHIRRDPGGLRWRLRCDKDRKDRRDSCRSTARYLGQRMSPCSGCTRSFGGGRGESR